MKKYLLMALAALSFAACAEKGEDNTSTQNGELEQSYVAVTLTADDINTRAADGKYEEGLAEERKVESAYVFFFEDGVAFPVAFDGDTSTNAGAKNYLKVTLSGNKEAMDNVSDVKDAVLVLQNYKGEYPNQMVALINWTPNPNKDSYSLAELRAEVSALGNKDAGFVMSNAVYAEEQATQTVDAVNLTVKNICKTPEEALLKPVTIHVERVAAKVVFTSNADGKFKVGEVDDTVDGKKYNVHAQIKGFELYNDYEQSWLIKKISPEWTGLGFNWNDEDWYRSYWATSLDTAFPENSFAWNSDNTDINGWVYCGENTREWTEAKDFRTKVIVKAQLVDDNNNPLTLVNWYGKDYIGEDHLKKVVANTLKSTYFVGNADGTVFTSITPEDIKCVARDPKAKNAYEVYFVIANESKGKNWYKYENGAYFKVELDRVNTDLAAAQPAHVYTNGMTYYWLDIKHLGQTGSTAEYGVVRNHVYKVNISGIQGYGTPVYNGDTAYLTPEKPVDISSYVSAQINILSWRVVANDYELN